MPSPTNDQNETTNPDEVYAEDLVTTAEVVDPETGEIVEAVNPDPEIGERSENEA